LGRIGLNFKGKGVNAFGLTDAVLGGDDDRFCAVGWVTDENGDAAGRLVFKAALEKVLEWAAEEEAIRSIVHNMSMYLEGNVSYGDRQILCTPECPTC
jgi:hypothetical protein